MNERKNMLPFFLSPMIISNFYLDNLHTYSVIIHRNRFYFDRLDGSQHNMPVQKPRTNQTKYHMHGRYGW